MKRKTELAVLVALVTLFSSSILSGAELRSGEWYVRLIVNAEASGLQDRGNVLGQLKDSLIGHDLHDLRELEGGFGSYLSLVFYHPEWNLEGDAYGSDYHPVARNKHDEWTFEVRSDDTGRDIVLSWEGQNTDMQGMVLVDLETSEVVPAVVDGVAGEHRFNMNGETVRAFQWVVLSQSEQRDSEKALAKSSKQTLKSDWQPPGWTRGRGHSKDIPAGLPEYPLGS